MRDAGGNDQRAEERVAPRGVGPERHSFFLQQLLVLLLISVRVDRSPGLGRLRDSVVEHEVEVQTDDCDHRAGDEKDVEIEKVGESSH
jgi:hypothetical protein